MAEEARLRLKQPLYVVVMSVLFSLADSPDFSSVSSSLIFAKDYAAPQGKRDRKDRAGQRNEWLEEYECVTLYQPYVDRSISFLKVRTHG